MINVSTEFKEALLNDNRNFNKYVTITLKDETVLNITRSQVWENGFKFSDGTSDSDVFTIGSVIIGKFTLLLNNIYDDFTDYDFNGAKVEPVISLTLSDGEEFVRCGVFTVDEATDNTSIITLECLNNLSKFDVDFTLDWNYPITLQNATQYLCNDVGVTLLSTAFDGGSMTIDEPLTTENRTNRQVLSFIMQMACKFAYCDEYGRLGVKFYDTEFLEDEELEDENYHHFSSFKSLDRATQDIEITGVQVTEEFDETDDNTKQTVLYGEEGYIISIAENPLISSGKASAVATYIGSKLVGMKFRPMSFLALGDPTVEAGDSILVTDRKGNQYKGYATNYSYTMGSSLSITCDAETLLENNTSTVSTYTKIIQKTSAETDKKISAYDKSVQLLTDVISKSFGLFKTEEVQTDGSIIYYSHNKPLLSDSDTIWKQTSDAFAVSTDGGETWNAGFDSEGNATVNILSAIGVNADWIVAGVLKDKTGRNYFNLDTGEASFTAYAKKENTSQVFTTQPTSYSINDLWILGEDYIEEEEIIYKKGYILSAVNASDTFDIDDWELKVKYTDNAYAESLVPLIQENTSSINQTSTEIESLVSEQTTQGDRIVELNQTVENQTSTFFQWQTDVGDTTSDLDNKINAEIATRTSQMRYEDGVLSLGQSGNNAKTYITPEGMTIKYNGEEVARAEYDWFYAQKLEVENDFVFSGFSWKRHGTNGNVGLRKV